MKSVLFAAAAMLAVATAAHAETSTTTSGYVQGSYTRPDVGVDGLGSGAIDVWSLKGAVAAPLSGAIGGQFDADVGDYRFGNSNFGAGDKAVFTPTGHIFYRNNQFTGGAFVGVETASHVTAVGGGAEGQYFVNPNWTLDGSIGYAGVTNQDLHIFGVRGGAKYFVNDNFALGGSVNYARLSESGFGHTDLWNLGVKGEYRLKSLPVSLSLAYERGELGDFNAHSDTLKVGVKWAFGAGSLRDENHHGASLGGVEETFGGEIGRAAIGSASFLNGGFGAP
jgi:hypothetical protein